MKLQNITYFTFCLYSLFTVLTLWGFLESELVLDAQCPSFSNLLELLQKQQTHLLPGVNHAGPLRPSTERQCVSHL